MTDTDQQFKLLDPDGEVIMSGPMNIILEQLPDTHARNAALDEMLQTAVQAVEGEERQERARVTTAKMLSDVATRLTQRMDAYVARREAQRKADEQEAEREEQLQIREMLDNLPDPDDPSQFPDPSLTLEDEELSYPSVPMSSVEEPPGTDPVYDPAELKNPQKQPSQPIAISLNAQEE